ncbi:DUF285 domain-containing protein [Echinicola marina]|uniref:BspA family leucine-rich repeat surface protein n=1 Tax=Echinicola marina TaxID=2859768 RepID=UPI001CF713DA|nr:BspA family leucine-rich repeat surface protein [Echinicola marina]UCS94302.1 DUF285 domain-containing protein [Echinicola marina]
MKTSLKIFSLFVTFGILMFSCESPEDPDPDQPNIYLDANGVTIKCEDCNVGDKGVVNGVEYEVVNNQLIRQRRDEEADMTTLCTSLVTDLKDFFLLSTGNGEFVINDFNQPIGNWDVSSVSDMSGMFAGTEFNQPIENWDVSNVENMRGMFYQSNFNQPIGDWDVGNVLDMNAMFTFTQFNQPIEGWDVSKVNDMEGIFWQASFNQPIGNWDVGRVTNMRGMFYDTPFNQDISRWCVTNITSEPSDFSIYAPLTEENKPKWGTCPE